MQQILIPAASCQPLYNLIISCHKKSCSLIFQKKRELCFDDKNGMWIMWHSHLFSWWCQKQQNYWCFGFIEIQGKCIRWKINTWMSSFSTVVIISLWFICTAGISGLNMGEINANINIILRLWHQHALSYMVGKYGLDSGIGIVDSSWYKSLCCDSC